MKPEVTILTKDSVTVDDTVYELKEIYVLSDDQIPEPEENWLNGSSCVVMSTQDVKFLYNGEWV